MGVKINLLGPKAAPQKLDDTEWCSMEMPVPDGWHNVLMCRVTAPHLYKFAVIEFFSLTGIGKHKGKIVAEGPDKYAVLAWHRAGHPAFKDLSDAAKKVSAELPFTQYNQWWGLVADAYSKIVFAKQINVLKSAPVKYAPEQKVDNFMDGLKASFFAPDPGDEDIKLEHY